MRPASIEALRDNSSLKMKNCPGHGFGATDLVQLRLVWPLGECWDAKAWTSSYVD